MIQWLSCGSLDRVVLEVLVPSWQVIWRHIHVFRKTIKIAVVCGAFNLEQANIHNHVGRQGKEYINVVVISDFFLEAVGKGSLFY